MSTREERWVAIDCAVEQVRPALRRLGEGGPLFWVISPRDFTRAIAWARRTPNSVSVQIREKLSAFAKPTADEAGPRKILDLTLGKTQPGNPGILQEGAESAEKKS
jgi:hypothetical protein